MKKNTKVIISFLISIGLLLALIAQLDWQDVANQLITVNYFFLLLSILPIIGQFYCRAVRWRYFLPEQKKPGLKLSLDGIMLGNFINYLLPLRAGELARPYFISKNSNISYSEAFAAVVIERFFDLAMVLLMFVGCTAIFTDFPEWISAGASALSILATCILLYIAAAIFLTEWIEKITDRFFNILPSKISAPLTGFTRGLFNGAHTLKNSTVVFNVCLQTILVWFWTVMQYFIALYIFNGHFEFAHGMLITVIIALSVAAPSAPGFVGVFQGACVAAFILLGFPKTNAFTYSILVHLLAFILIIGYGLYIQYQYGFKINSLKEKS